MSGKRNDDIRAVESAESNGKALEQLPDTSMSTERARKHSSPTIATLTLEWGSDEASVVQRVHASVTKKIEEDFAEPLALVRALRTMARAFAFDDPETQSAVMHGEMEPAVNEWGLVRERYDRIPHSERENLLLRIAANVVEWEATAEAYRREALLAKSIWEEIHADEFVLSNGKTDGLRESDARRRAASRRHFAAIKTSLSREADRVVSSVRLLDQRLKDSMQVNV